MGWVVNATTGRFTPGKYPVPIVDEGPRAGLDGCGKSRPPPGFDPWTVAIPNELSRPTVCVYVCNYLWNTARYHTG
jgi:hypothetical protein